MSYVIQSIETFEPSAGCYRGTVTKCFFFCFRANKWEDLAPLPQKKGDLVCRFFNDKLVVAGGMGAESMEVLPQVHKKCYRIVPNLRPGAFFKLKNDSDFLPPK